MRQKLLIISLAVIALSIATTGTWAYFTVTKTATNVITMGDVDIALIEQMELSDGTLVPFVNAVGVTAGDSISKIITVENTGNSDAWVRIAVAKSVVSEDGGFLDADVMTFVLGVDWLLDDDGYYYYTKSLSSGDVTTPLWEAVDFSTQIDTSYGGATGTIDVTAYAVQVANNSIPDGGDVSDILGWP